MVSKWQRLQMCYGYHLDCYKRCAQSQALLRLRQQAKLQKLLTAVSRTIPFYQEFVDVDFKQFPIIDKSVLQENYVAFNKFQWSPQQALLGNHPAFAAMVSAGSSGGAGIYLRSQAENINAFTDLLSKILRVFSWWQHPKIACFHLTPVGYFASEQLDGVVSWLNLNLHEDFRKLLMQLQNFQPEILIAPVQTLLYLAKLQASQQIHLSLKKVISIAEVLTPVEEKFLFDVFQLPIQQLYQCAEGTLGFTCKHGTLHLNEDLFLIEKEWLDLKQKRFTPVITALSYYVQPLIRYRMEDILLLKDSCPCQSPLMAVEKILGRCQDILYLPQCHDEHICKPLYFDAIYQMMSQVAGDVKNYQFVQYSPQHIGVKMQTNNVNLATRSLVEKLQNLCQREGIKVPHVTFAPLEDESLDHVFRHVKRAKDIAKAVGF